MFETVVWGVGWLFVGSFLALVIYGCITMLFAWVYDKIAPVRSSDGFFLGLILGWVLAAAWEVWVLIQVVLHIIRIIQLLTGQVTQ